MYTVTFYSYKGGVGRTMALVNVAALLAKQGKRILIVDFDLEAPGVPSYGLLGHASGHKGIVDYVHHYLSTSEAANAAEYIVECPLGDEQSIWVMPAGDNSQPSYSGRFASIDWAYLYAHQHGYDLLDDLKEQWALHESNFDYVFIDSRTGNTDIAGICTRQLPDAVVNMFVPTRQNIDGLSPIIDEIRAEAIEAEREIDLLFCPSNIPDLFDEDDILGKALKSASERLGYGSPGEFEPPVSYIRHWPNMELLEQPLVALSRSQSKLVKEYNELKTAIISQNPADRDGALAALERMPSMYEAARKAKNGQAATKVVERAIEISWQHEKDTEVAIAAAELFSTAGEYAHEERCLSDAIRTSSGVERARLLRAVARINLNKKEDAMEDLRGVITSPKGTLFEFRPAVQLLRTFANSPIEEAITLLNHPGTRLRAKIALGHLIMHDRKNNSLVADSLLAGIENERSSLEHNEDAINAAMLALIGATRFQEALAIGKTETQNETISRRFNLAIAEWGLTGSASPELFADLDERVSTDDGDQNMHQCIALVRGVVGRIDDALLEISKSEERITPGGAFSCWTFSQRTPDEFRSDLADMRDAIEHQKELRPLFLIAQN